MLSLKKAALAALIWGCGSCNAGAIGDFCQQGSVTVPCKKTAWDAAIYALYLHPTINIPLGYYGSRRENNHAFFNPWGNDRGWGFNLQAAYHFNFGNDVHVDWTHFSVKQPADLILSFPATHYSHVSAKEWWDSVNVEFGQTANFGENKTIRFHGGMQYFNFKEGLSRSNWLNNPGAYSGGVAVFRGFGPRTGLDMSYDWVNGFKIYANTAGGFVVGKSKVDVWMTFDNSTIAGAINLVVPEVDLKLGAKYQHAMARGLLSIDSGWMFINYYNAIHSFGAVLAGQTNINFNGPYIGFKWMSDG